MKNNNKKLSRFFPWNNKKEVHIHLRKKGISVDQKRLHQRTLLTVWQQWKKTIFLKITPLKQINGIKSSSIPQQEFSLLQVQGIQQACSWAFHFQLKKNSLNAKVSILFNSTNSICFIIWKINFKTATTDIFQELVCYRI